MLWETLSSSPVTHSSRRSPNGIDFLPRVEAKDFGVVRDKVSASLDSRRKCESQKTKDEKGFHVRSFLPFFRNRPSVSDFCSLHAPDLVDQALLDLCLLHLWHHCFLPTKHCHLSAFYHLHWHPWLLDLFVPLHGQWKGKTCFKYIILKNLHIQVDLGRFEKSWPESRPRFVAKRPPKRRLNPLCPKSRTMSWTDVEIFLRTKLKYT